MSKQESKNDNIVLFPGLDKRLLEKGMEMLHEKNFRQAAKILEQARMLDSENSEVYVGLILAYFELGHSQEAKHLAEEMLNKGIGDYIQVIDLYIMILVQLSEYEAIVTTLEALLEERKIPREKYEHFSKLLHFSRKMNDEYMNGDDANEAVVTESEGEKLDLFAYRDPKEQMLIAARLAKENIRPYISEIKGYLHAIEGHPFQKTMLLNILREQEYNQEVQVEKFSLSGSFTPNTLPNIHEMAKLKEVSAILETMLENEDPILCENIISLVERNFFLFYPFEPEPEDSKAWAAAHHFVVNAYYGHEDSVEDFAVKYETTNEEVGKACDYIKKLEEISYPII